MCVLVVIVLVTAVITGGFCYYKNRQKKINTYTITDPAYSSHNVPMATEVNPAYVTTKPHPHSSMSQYEKVWPLAN